MDKRELDNLRAGLGALRKRIKDRIKNNAKNPERPNALLHLEKQNLRIERVNALLDKLNSYEDETQENPLP